MYKTEDNVPAGKFWGKNKNKKNKKNLHSKSQWKEPDHLVRGTDPRIRTRTKMLRIPNTS